MLNKEKFEQTYQKIVEEYNNIMEKSRKEAKVENRHNILILIVIVVINIALNIGISMLINTFSFEVLTAFITVSAAIFAWIKHRGGKSKIEKYEREFKENVIGMMVESFEDGFEFTPSERINFRSL